MANASTTVKRTRGNTEGRTGESTSVVVQPMDQSNRLLIARAHPPEWRNPTPDGRYNLVVIGGGTAGLVGAIEAAGLGGKVALVEKHLLGGHRLNTGCVPSKALIRSARVIGELRKAAELGIQAPTNVQVDFTAIMARMRAIRADISHDDSAQRLTKERVQLFLGSASFSGPHSLEVFDGKQRQTLQFAKALIATGSRPRKLELPGLEEAGYLTNETLFQLTDLPDHLVVIGGGPLGAEMAQVFARFGSQVTIFVKQDGFLPREDRDAAAIVQQALEADGVRFVSGATLQSVQVAPAGKVIHYEQNGQTHRVAADEILVAIGRTPNLEELNLAAAQVEHTDSGVVVNGALRTTNSSIYAAGDVASGYRFTHVADAAAHLAVQNALSPRRDKKFDASVIPWCTYTDPEVAHVGIYEHAAEAAGIKIDTFQTPLAKVDRSRTDGEAAGFVKVHVKHGSDKIVGATIVSSKAGELINELTLAIVTGAGLKTIATVIHPYPTQGDAIKKSADAYTRTRVRPLAKRFRQGWLAFRRR